jgi:hypothetical protein
MNSEKELFDLLVLKTLGAGGTVGFPRSGIKWKKTADAYVRQEDRGDRTWPTVDELVLQDIHKQVCKEFDDAVFYLDDVPDGVTWRMLKLEMSYLRIVLSDNKDATKLVLGEIIRRLVSIMNEAIHGGKDYVGRN